METLKFVGAILIYVNFALGFPRSDVYDENEVELDVTDERLDDDDENLGADDNDEKTDDLSSDTDSYQKDDLNYYEPDAEQCKPGSYYWDVCNICYCTGLGKRSCTNLNCDARPAIPLSKVQKSAIYEKWRGIAAKCTEGERLTYNNCVCHCRVPSVVTCPSDCFTDVNSAD